MIPKDSAETLRSLMKLDYDAAIAYEKAIARVRTPGIKHTLTRFREDHERHVKGLTELIEKQGWFAPEPSLDVRSVFVTGIAVTVAKPGELAIVKACESGEKYTNFGYGEAFKRDFPFEIMRLLQKNYMDERHHLSYIQHLIRTRGGLGIGKAVGLGALGAAASLVAWRRLARA